MFEITMKETFVVFVIVLNVFGWNGLGVDGNIYVEPGEQLIRYMQRANFDMNDDVEVKSRSSDDIDDFADSLLDDAYIEYVGCEITLHNLEIIGAPNPQLTKSVANMMYGYLDTALEWDNVTVEGRYEFFDKPGDYDSLVATGRVRMIWHQINATGRIAFHPLEEDDGFLSTIYDLDFIGENFTNILLDSDKNALSSRIISAASDRIKGYLENDVFWRLQINLRKNVDKILKGRSIKHMFGNNEEMLVKYKLFIRGNEDLANAFVDNMLVMLQKGLNESGYANFPIPDLRRNFTRNFGGIATITGFLSFHNGVAQNISSIRRKSDFSLAVSDGIELSGFLEFTDLSIYFRKYNAKVWNIGVTGAVVATAADNALFIKLIVTKDDRSKLGFKLLGYDLKASINHVQVEATGLSFLLNWVLSLVATSTVNYFKGNIALLIEDNLKQVLDRIIYSTL